MPLSHASAWSNVAFPRLCDTATNHDRRKNVQRCYHLLSNRRDRSKTPHAITMSPTRPLPMSPLTTAPGRLDPLTGCLHANSKPSTPHPALRRHVRVTTALQTIIATSRPSPTRPLHHPAPTTAPHSYHRPSLRFIGLNTLRYASLREIALPSSVTCCKPHQCNTAAVSVLQTSSMQHSNTGTKTTKEE